MTAQPQPEYSSIRPHVTEELTGGAYRVQWSEAYATPGTPQVRGELTLEHNPDLYPLKARGYAYDVGEYWRLQYHPALFSNLARPRRTLCATPFRVERPELPEWADHRDADAADRAYDLCRRMLFEAQSRPWEFTKAIREASLSQQVSGFYLGEAVASRRWMKLEGEACAREYLFFGLPQFRAPWTVEAWITQREVLVGVILCDAQVSEYDGTQGYRRVVIPAAKLVHCASEEVGFNPEGVSAIRPVFNAVNRLLDLDDAERLNVELYATGELFFEDALGKCSEPDKAKLANYIATRRASHGGGAVLPQGVRATYSSPSSSMPDLQPIRDAEHRSIDRATESEHRGIAEAGSGGAYAARSEAADDARDGLDYLAQEWIAGFLQRWFALAIRVNFPHDVAAGRIYLPSVKWGVVEERDVNKWLATVVQAWESGLLSHPTLGPVLADQLDVPFPGDTTNAPAEAPGTPGDAATSGQMLDPAEVMQRWSLSRGTVLRLLKTKQLRGGKLGSRWRVDANSVEEYLRGRMGS